MRSYVIVGSGIAALSAAEAIRREDRAGRITLVAAERQPFYSRPGLAYFLDGSLPEWQLALRSPEELRELGLQQVHAAATEVNPAAHRVRLDRGLTLDYDRLLLATGARSVPPDFPGGDLRGVFRLDGLDDARAIARAARRGRRAVVVGGGSTALELVEALLARRVTTHYLLRGEHYWTRVLDAAESALVEDQLERDSARLYRRTRVARALGSEGALEGVETDAGEYIACDLLAVATGVRPRAGLAAAAGLDVQRGIVTDEQMATSAGDIFAAGDVAEVREPGGAGLLDTLWRSAAAQGAVAGANMTGAGEVYRRVPAMNVTRLAGVTTTIVGSVGGAEDADLVALTRGQSERWRTPPDAVTVSDNAGSGRVRLVLGPRRIQGALIMGDQSLSDPVARLIAGEADISAVHGILLHQPERLRSTLLDVEAEWRGAGGGRGTHL